MVMPCSRSARRPSVSKREVGAVRAALVGGLLDGFELVLEDGLAVVQQPPDQRALAVVYAACRDEPEGVPVP